MTVVLPNADRNLAGAQLIPGAVLEAVEFLELERDVEIKWSAGISLRGCHRFRDGSHVITVSTYLDADQLSRTLWHELTHAVQVEGFDTPADGKDALRNERRRRGYQASRFEQEARRWAEDFHADLRLAR